MAGRSGVVLDWICSQSTNDSGSLMIYLVDGFQLLSLQACHFLNTKKLQSTLIHLSCDHKQIGFICPITTFPGALLALSPQTRRSAITASPISVVINDRMNN